MSAGVCGARGAMLTACTAFCTVAAKTLDDYTGGRISTTHLLLMNAPLPHVLNRHLSSREGSGAGIRRCRNG
jgi:hypothetical protein